MSRRERVVRALGRLRKPGEATRSPDRREAFAPSGDELVRVALVRRIPDDPVPRAVEGPVERESELDDTEVRGQVAAGLGDRLDDDVPALGRQLRQLLGRKAFRSWGLRCGPDFSWFFFGSPLAIYATGAGGMQRVRRPTHQYINPKRASAAYLFCTVTNGPPA